MRCTRRTRACASRLPGARGVARRLRPRPWGVAEGQPIALHADTLRIDGDEERCTLAFRATFPVADEAALPALRVVLGVETPGQPITWPDPASLFAPVESPESYVLSSRDFESVSGGMLEGTLSIEDAPTEDAPVHFGARPRAAVIDLEGTLASSVPDPVEKTLHSSTLWIEESPRSRRCSPSRARRPRPRRCASRARRRRSPTCG